MEETNRERILRDYEAYIKLERNLSDNSVGSYMHDIKMFADYMQDSCSVCITNSQAHHIEGFMAWLYDKGMSKTSQARILSGVKSFYNFLVYSDLIECSPTEFIEAPKIGRHLPDTLSVQQIDAMLAAIDVSQPQGHRNRALLEILYSCGLRVSELVGIKISDIFFDDGFMRVTGKGDKQRLVPVNDDVCRLIRLYLDQRVSIRPDTSSRNILFLNRRGGKLSRIMVFNIVKQSALYAGIDKNVSPHTLRHSFATHLLEGGANIRQIQEMLGHESILTTEIYTHLDRGHLRKSLEEHHPLK